MGFSPNKMLLSKRHQRALLVMTKYKNTIPSRNPDCHREPFPVHSPLLGESDFVYFHCPTDMLKFSAFSCSTSCSNDDQSCPERCACAPVDIMSQRLPIACAPPCCVKHHTCPRVNTEAIMHRSTTSSHVAPLAYTMEELCNKR